MFGPILAALGQSGRGEEAMRQSMFSYINPTFNTGITTKTAPTAYDATHGFCYMYNGDASRWALLDRLFLRMTQANTGATSWHICFTKDKGNLYSSGGTDVIAAAVGAGIVNIGATTVGTTGPTLPTSIIRPSIISKMYVGDITLNAATASSRLLYRKQVRSVIFAANDSLDITFGEGTSGSHGTTTAGAEKSLSFPPVWIAPGEGLLISELAPGPQSQNPAPEIAISWLERPAP